MNAKGIWIAAVLTITGLMTSQALGRPLYSWDNDSADGQWSTALNWTNDNAEGADNEVPVADSTAVLNVNGDTVTIDERQPATAGDYFKVEVSGTNMTINILTGGELYASSQSFIDNGSALNVDASKLETGKWQLRGGLMVLKNGATYLGTGNDFEHKGGVLQLEGSGNSFDATGGDEFAFGRQGDATIKWIADPNGITTLFVNDYWGEDGARDVEIDVSAMTLSHGMTLLLIDALEGLNESGGGFLDETFTSTVVSGSGAFGWEVLYDVDNDDISIRFSDPALAIPEPVSALAVMLGVGALGRYVRRRRS